jgi:T4-like virus Myoviridae tail sheath stabiliser
MLSGQHFYYRTIRRNVISFGTLFKNIQMYSYEANTTNEVKRINVPLTYAGKENFLTRLLGNPDLHKPTQIVLPRMSFEMTNIEYDSTRKLSPYLKNTFGSGSSVTTQHTAVPYNLDFELNIYVRNVEDGTQIVEQILPYFNPDYTLSMMFVDEMNISRDVPIILESVNYDPKYEGDAEETVRILVWTLRFKMKTYFFGPTTQSKIILQSNVNISQYSSSPSDIYILYTDPGFLNYATGETVYQGNSLSDATTTATVVSWQNNNAANSNVANILTVTNKQGKDFSLTANIVGTQSYASSRIASYLPENQLLQHIVVIPNPANANSQTDFGFTTIITEWPDL